MWQMMSFGQCVVKDELLGIAAGASGELFSAASVGVRVRCLFRSHR